MSLFEYFIIYIVIWWIAFFISLPMGVKKPENIEIGHDSGAPVSYTHLTLPTNREV